jgi:tetratricopeptide (TPR) repeat protein
MNRPYQGAGTIILLISAVLSRAEDHPDAHAIAAFEAQIKAGRYAEAKAALDPYVLAHRNSWQALYQLGYVDFRLHYIRESVKALSACLVLNSGFAEAHKILALDLNILGRKDLALRELEKSLSLDPQSAESAYELGRIYYDQGSYLKAVEYLERAEQLDPAFVKVHHNLGLAYFAIGKKNNAVREFEEGLRLNARQAQPSAWPLIDYAAFFNLESEFAKARDMLLASLRISDQWDQAFDELSKAYRGLGETEKAIESLRRAIVLNPRKAEYRYVLARLYSQVHQSSQAKQELAEYEKLRQHSDSP